MTLEDESQSGTTPEQEAWRAPKLVTPDSTAPETRQELTDEQKIQQEIDQIADPIERARMQKLKGSALNYIEEIKNLASLRKDDLEKLYTQDRADYEKAYAATFKRTGANDSHSLAAITIINNLLDDAGRNTSLERVRRETKEE